jgi:hypothetical protein
MQRRRLNEQDGDEFVELNASSRAMQRRRLNEQDGDEFVELNASSETNEILLRILDRLSALFESSQQNATAIRQLTLELATRTTSSGSVRTDDGPLSSYMVELLQALAFNYYLVKPFFSEVNLVDHVCAYVMDVSNPGVPQDGVPAEEDVVAYVQNHVHEWAGYVCTFLCASRNSHNLTVVPAASASTRRRAI